MLFRASTQTTLILGRMRRYWFCCYKISTIVTVSGRGDGGAQRRGETTQGRGKGEEEKEKVFYSIDVICMIFYLQAVQFLCIGIR